MIKQIKEMEAKFSNASADSEEKTKKISALESNLKSMKIYYGERVDELKKQLDDKKT